MAQIPCFDEGGYRQFGFKLGNTLHCGKDYKCPINTKVLNCESGEVVYINERVNGFGGYDPLLPGSVVWIKSKNLFFLYGHVLPNKDLKIGSLIKEGDCIGKVHNYISSGLELPHLHFGILKSNNIFNKKWGYVLPNEIKFWINPDIYLKGIF